MEWKDLAARLRCTCYIRCALTGAWNGRRVNCQGFCLGRHARRRLALARVLAPSANCLANALACEGWGAGTESMRSKVVSPSFYNL